MGYSIELYFEKRFDDKIRLLWNKLKELGLPSVFKDINSKPHLSLAVLENIDENNVSEAFDTFIKNYTSFELDFNEISLFEGLENAVYLAPARNTNLFHFQRCLYDLLRDLDFKVLERYEPENWIPHASLSKELSKEDAIKTIEICKNFDLTGKVNVIEAGIIEFRPRREIVKRLFPSN